MTGCLEYVNFVIKVFFMNIQFLANSAMDKLRRSLVSDYCAPIKKNRANCDGFNRGRYRVNVSCKFCLADFSSGDEYLEHVVTYFQIALFIFTGISSNGICPEVVTE